MVDEEDRQLIEAARTIIRARYRQDWHVVGCALRGRSGRIHLGVHLECDTGRVTVCAEAVAIGRAVTDGDAAFDKIVAVRQSSAGDGAPAVVAPCGMCREMISDYAPDCRVIVPSDDGVTVTDLLPNKYARLGT